MCAGMVWAYTAGPALADYIRRRSGSLTSACGRPADACVEAEAELAGTRNFEPLQAATPGNGGHYR